jgi:hypothetical protein
MLSDQELIDGLRAELADLRPAADLLLRLRQQAAGAPAGSRRSWTRPRLTISHFVAGAAVAATVAVVAVFVTSVHHASPIRPASRTVTTGCGAAGARELARGTPPNSLLAILAVLRRPQRSQDQLPRSAPPFYRNGSSNFHLPRSALPSRRRAALSTSAAVYPYTRYVRRARAATFNGRVDYLIPLAAATNLAHSSRCSRPYFAGIALLQTGSGGQSSSCCLKASLILARHGASTSSSTGAGTVLTDVVPDQVSTVTVHFIPRPGLPGPGGSSPDGRGYAIIARPLGNIVAVRVPRNSRARIVWRNAAGQIIKRYP